MLQQLTLQQHCTAQARTFILSLHETPNLSCSPLTSQSWPQCCSQHGLANPTSPAGAPRRIASHAPIRILAADGSTLTHALLHGAIGAPRHSTMHCATANKDASAWRVCFSYLLRQYGETATPSRCGQTLTLAEYPTALPLQSAAIHQQQPTNRRRDVACTPRKDAGCTLRKEKN